MLKRLNLVLSGLIFISTNLIAQFDKPLIPDSCVDEIEIYPVYEKHPEFPGGIDSLYCFVENRLDFDYINSINTNGRCFYMFSIDTLGKARFDSSFRSIDKKLDLQMEKIINSFPKWTPAEINGYKVSAGYTYVVLIPYKRKCLK
jgi:hypothetical protein